MEIDYDAGKDAFNREKHGVSLKEAKNLDWSSLIASIDERRFYGEERMVGFALMNSRLYCVVFTDRNERRRIISLRKANSREVRRYVKARE